MHFISFLYLFSVWFSFFFFAFLSFLFFYSVWHRIGRSDHGTVRPLHLQELDDEGGAPSDYLWRQVAQGTVLDAHDRQLAAQGQLKGQAVKVGVVIQIQLLEVLQCTCVRQPGRSRLPPPFFEYPIRHRFQLSCPDCSLQAELNKTWYNHWEWWLTPSFLKNTGRYRTKTESQTYVWTYQ